MFMISTNRKKNRITIEEDGYLPAYSAYEQGAMTYKVSMKLTDFEGLLPISVLDDIQDREIEEAANDDVNFIYEMREMVKNHDKSLHFIEKIGKVE